MTEARVGVVDVYVLRRVGDAWEVLLLQRAAGTRCPGSWETVHGRIEAGERPEDAALREVREETGLEAERLYNVTVQAFYLHTVGAVMLDVVFAAVVRAGAGVTVGSEHTRAEWLSIPAASERYTWPRSRAVLAEIAHLLRGGDAGVAEDALRVL